LWSTKYVRTFSLGHSINCIYSLLSRYMQGFKCSVTGSTSAKTVAPAKPPIYCGDGKNKCVTGAKQMIAWNRQSFPTCRLFFHEILTFNLVSHFCNNADVEQNLPETMSSPPQMATGSTMAIHGVTRMVCSLAFWTYAVLSNMGNHTGAQDDIFLWDAVSSMTIMYPEYFSFSGKTNGFEVIYINSRSHHMCTSAYSIHPLLGAEYVCRKHLAVN
jgi:hypothetical protein